MNHCPQKDGRLQEWLANYGVIAERMKKDKKSQQRYAVSLEKKGYLRRRMGTLGNPLLDLSDLFRAVNQFFGKHGPDDDDSLGPLLKTIDGSS